MRRHHHRRMHFARALRIAHALARRHRRRY
jgi:hypothetical protein